MIAQAQPAPIAVGHVAVTALRDVVGAVESAEDAEAALRAVLEHFNPSADTSWEALRHGATRLLKPWLSGAEVREIVAEYRRSARNGRRCPEGAGGAAAVAWAARPDLPGAPEPDPLPIEVLPESLRRHVESVAGATQTPAELGALLGLAAISAAVAGKVRILACPRRGWREQPTLYVAAILPPGARKSPTFELFEAPIRAWEEEAQRAVSPLHRAGLDRIEVLEKELDRAKREAASGTGAGLDAVEDARRKLDEARAEVPRLPRLLASDATPEALVRLMADQGGRIALLSPEGDPFRLADGRYSNNGGARLDELKRAWSGEAIRVDRVSREPIHVPRPALVLAVTMQPGVLESLRNARAFRGEGVLARILWLRPDAGLGSRLTGANVPALDRSAEGGYAKVLRRLLQAEVDEERGQMIPHELPLSPEALAVLHEFEAEIEAELAPGGRMVIGGASDWAAKACGQAIRIAGLLELWARAEDGRPLWSASVGRWAMQAGVRLVRALSTHTLAVYGDLERHPRIELQQYLLTRLRELPEGSSERDLFEASKGRSAISCMDDLRELLDQLEERGCLRRLPPSRRGPGRPPSPTIELHPDLGGDVRKIPGNAAQEGRTKGSADSANLRMPSQPHRGDDVEDVLG